MAAILKEDMNKMTCRTCCSDRIDKGFIPFRVAEPLQLSQQMQEQHLVSV